MGSMSQGTVMPVSQNRQGLIRRPDAETDTVIKIERGLAASSRLSEETRHAGCDIKPCVTLMLEKLFGLGEHPSRSDVAIAMACELRRIDQSYDETLNRLVEWNQRNETPIHHNEIERTVGNAFTKDYAFGCNHRTLAPFCVGPEICPYRRFIAEPTSRIKPWQFIKLGWQHHLGSNETLIYQIALPYLETTKGGGIGRRIFANHRQIADACGIASRRVGRHLEVLAGADLIDYVPGLSLKWAGKATEIRRIAPIPRPTKDRLAVLKEIRASIKARDSPASTTLRYLSYVATFVTLYCGHFGTN